MQNYFILALMVTLFYVIFGYLLKFINRKQNKNEVEEKVSARNMFLVFGAVFVSLFLCEKMGFMRLVSLKSVVETPAFTNNPDF